MLQENFAAIMGDGTGFLPSNHWPSERVSSYQALAPFSNAVSNLESMLTDLVNYQRVLQKHNPQAIATYPTLPISP